MRKLFLLLVLFIVPLSLHAQSYVANPIDATTRISQFIINELFNPMTHYHEDDLRFSLYPMYFKVDKIIESGGDLGSEYGDNLRGFAFAISMDYAITDFFSTYIIYVNTRLKGAINNNLYRYEFDTMENHAIQFGIGYDIMEFFNTSSKWSIPICAGGTYQKYSTEITISRHENTSYKGRAYGDNYAYAYNFGFAVARKLNLFDLDLIISPSLNLVDYIKEPEVSAEDNLGLSYSSEMGGGTSASGMYPGINITYLTDSSLSFSLNLSGLVATRTNFYNDMYFDGMQINTIGIRVTYNSTIISSTRY